MRGDGVMACAAAIALCAASPAAAQSMLPEPTAPAPRVVVEDGVAPTYYRRSPHVALLWLRGALGAQLRAAEHPVAFSFDLHAGVALRLGREARVALVGEAGGGYTGFSEWLASAGVGVLYGVASPREEGIPWRWRLALIPHVVAGAVDGRDAVGARTSVIVGFGVYALEFAHQVTWVDGEPVHEGRIAFTSLVANGEDR